MELGNRAFLDTRDSAQFLGERGFKVAPATLDTKRSRGGGPKFRRLGPRIVYEPQELLDWAHANLSPPFANTSEASAPVAAENGHGRDILQSAAVRAAIEKAVQDAVEPLVRSLAGSRTRTSLALPQSLDGGGGLNSSAAKPTLIAANRP
jgi:hypothetical protein